jgi:ribonuclease VapC
MKSTVLDSYAVISFLQRQPGHEEVSKIFEECVSKDREAFLCIVNWGEVIYHAYRTGGENRARLTEDAIKALPIQIVELDEKGRDLTRQAAQLKAAHKMSYADCFAGAVAMRKKCELMTGDKEFKQIEKETKIRWML